MQQLEDLGSIASESMHVDWFIDHINNLDYEYTVEALKAIPGVSLETCYSCILCKAADVAKPKPRDRNTLTPREMRIRLPDKPLPSQQSNDNVDLEKYKQDNGMIFILQEILDGFSQEKCKEIRDLNGLVRRVRNKRKT